MLCHIARWTLVPRQTFDCTTSKPENEDESNSIAVLDDHFHIRSFRYFDHYSLYFEVVGPLVACLYAAIDISA
jgi:hypothetical protein